MKYFYILITMKIYSATLTPMVKIKYNTFVLKSRFKAVFVLKRTPQNLITKMLNIKELTKALKQVADEKGLDPDKVLDVIESSIAAAYKKEYGERGEVVKCKMDQKTGEL